MGQGAIAATLTHALQQNRIAPAYLFCGPRGTGKTSSARILAKSLNCLRAESPTAEPCGECDVCQAVTRGSALDIVEIDAASNTGVDNIRELIERAQFAPVQCRYKVYVIDECLTGDTLVATESGPLRIDDPDIEGQKVLSYDETSKTWEFKEAVRWLDQGERQTYIIETNRSKIKCTGNHLIRTETGWVAAKNVKEGTKILSPVNADAETSFLNTEWMGASVDLPAATSSKETLSGQSHIVSKQSWQKWSPNALSASATAASNLQSQNLCSKKATALKAFSLTGKGIHTDPNTAFGTSGLKTLLKASATYPQQAWASSTELCWETALLHSLTSTVDFPGLLGRTENRSKSGWNTRLADYPSCARVSDWHRIKGMEKHRSSATRLAIPNSQRSFNVLSQKIAVSVSRLTGSIKSQPKVSLGGTWMMARFNLLSEVVRVFSFIQKDFLWKKITSLLTGFQSGGMQPKSEHTKEPGLAKSTHTSIWEQRLPENFWLSSDHSRSPRWTTSLHTVKRVEQAGVERVYDIEVADNHNFVANGLLVHNCHMLSTAAFNALLKTLEEPPDRVVFVLATTDPQRVLPTIISRCQRFDFRRIPLPAMIKHLSYIADKESINIAESGVQLVAQISQGGLRDAESLLDQLSLQSDEITVDSVWDLVGAVPERDLLNLVRAIAADDGTALLERVRNLMDKGREPLIVLQSLVGFYRDLLIAKSAPARADMVAITPPTWAEMTDFAQQLSVPQLLASQQKLQAAEVQVKNTTQPRLWLEITLSGLLPSALGAVAHLSANSSPSRSARAVLSVANPPVISSAPVGLPPIKPPTANSSPAAPTNPAAENPEAPPHASPPAADSTTEEPPKSPPISQEPPIAPAVAPSLPEPVEPEPEPPGEVAFGSLAELWTKILEALAPRGTQMLMSQQGVLLSFDGVGAKVGFRSASLQKMAQERVPNLEEAFKKVFQRPIKVFLEVVAPDKTEEKKTDKPSDQPTSGRSPASPPDSRPAPPPPRPIAPTNSKLPSESPPPGIPPQNGPLSNGQSSSSPNNSSANTSSAINSSDNDQKPGFSSRKPTDAPQSQSPGSSLPSSGTPNPDWTNNQDQDNIKRFAQFFNGQIVNLDDDDNEQSPPSQKSPDPGPDVPF